VMAKAHGLESPQPIMCSSRESDHSMCMFRSGNKYYLWDPNVGDTWETVTAMNAVDIVTEIAKQGLESLKLTATRKEVRWSVRSEVVESKSAVPIRHSRLPWSSPSKGGPLSNWAHWMGGKMGEEWSQIWDPWLWGGGGHLSGPSLKADLSRSRAGPEPA
jgi:hypothetical protein